MSQLATKLRSLGDAQVIETRVRDPANGFCSSGMPTRLGGELSVTVGSA